MHAHTEKGYVRMPHDVYRSAGDKMKSAIILHSFCFHLVLSSLPPLLHLSVTLSILFLFRLRQNHEPFSTHGRQCESNRLKSDEKWETEDFLKVR